LRLWLDVFAGVLNPAAAQVLGALGATAILWGSFQAIRQTRLKLLVAYSTVAQLGYLFLLFPLGAFSAGLHHALAHALAKAAMFMVAGAVIHACGSDELEDIGGAARRLPLATLTFALAGFTLLGLPPSAGYHSKELFLAAVHASGQWWWLERAGEGANFRRVPWPMTWAPLLLALLAALFGLLPQGTLSGLLEVGR
jgi:NADH:ubiquinone oxidoreductase subunit 5 (subunit L)/multisubunit Na+/H+ antiporter MnhA subunit